MKRIMNQCNCLRIRKFVFLFLLISVISFLLYYFISTLLRMINNGMSSFYLYHLCDIVNKIVSNRKDCTLEITPSVLIIIICILILFMFYIIFIISADLWRMHQARNAVEAYSIDTSIRKLSKSIENQLTFDDNDDVVLVFEGK